MNRYGRGALLGAAAMTFTLTACSQDVDMRADPSRQATIHVDGSGKSYTNAEALGRDSDVVLRGRVTALAGTAVDNGGLGPDASGLPMAFYTVKVIGSNRSADVPATIRVANLDRSKVASDSVAPIEIGQEYVLFLEKRTAETAPGVASWAPFYIPTGGGFGVFRIEGGGQAVAFQRELTKVRPASPAGARVNDRLAVEPRILLATK